ncbi:MAG: hypothetical protein JRI47_08440 [Deltaproteobacteria bacterium]|nr:hypothetical protein [Deltaproteobacteria bacterium]
MTLEAKTGVLLCVKGRAEKHKVIDTTNGVVKGVMAVGTGALCIVTRFPWPLSAVYTQRELFTCRSSKDAGSATMGRLGVTSVRGDFSVNIKAVNIGSVIICDSDRCPFIGGVTVNPDSDG